MFESYCFVCGLETNNKYPLCDSCKPTTLKKGMVCRKCGIPTSLFVDQCSMCITEDIQYKNNYSFFLYSSVAKEILKLYKFKKQIIFSYYYAELIIDYIKGNFEDPIICPVPTSLIKRKIKNGYQLDPILKILRYRGLRVEHLLRKRFSKTQKKLNRVERFNNLNDSFKVVKKIDSNRPIILLDDVFTTGATINACSKLFKNSNMTIYSITLYRD
ncbi:ComF family protein [Thiospirochaeta perfilievii]|uniref:ComF family protein n=1 Tax=Thiospirochaeta perfilievii TaxID=252967 RepID=A0A5C1QFJ7_9SPIO|nr:ComF family protein [Thiospirochaeta perfilievii]QEN06291.1 ComF family protein [Thiospirochaeta perfilievii]